MTLPPALRYRLVRLKPLGRALSRPKVWGSLGGLGLLAVVVPQYLRHPEWRSQYDPAVDSAAIDANTNVGALSSEDLADLAEIDNLAVLLNQMQPTTAATLETTPPADTAPLALPTATADQPVSTSPFAQYLERSRFRVNPVGNDSAAGAPDTTPGQPGADSLVRSPETTQPSALQQALNQRLGARQPAEPPAETAPADSATAAETVTPSPWMVEGSLPGVDQRFIRTTPQMSPPPGTTGYTPPPSLAPVPAAVPNAAPTAPAALNLNFGAPTAPPPAGVTVPPAGTLGNSPGAPVAQPEPPPFSAPRPPGVYTGNGYINTFADPSGPAN
ncbi:hypothetical protein PGN35_001155 [Nodosilinea sp. PGN35]|uniref:hypothetical protein n=1 Tax=Nodosilinea sp. PGN35 TaxID=3020489 RepID=UPI0023B26575|nr:hypothetical protein [Nodosilinea sp. TSF1-S3]MDF0368986.1 hypothetical protein [Nodosilinea sp. TSF1-S3]